MAVISESSQGNGLLKELVWSATYAVLLAIMVVAFISISGESFHENFGIVLRISVAPIGFISWLFGRVDLAWPIIALVEFAWFFIIVAVVRFFWHRWDK